MEERDAAKREVQAEIDRLRPDLLTVSRFLHANPEIAFEEHKAADLLMDPDARLRIAAEFAGT